MKAKAKLQWNLKAFMLASLLTMLLLLTTYGLYTAWKSQYVEERKQRAQTELLNLRKNLFYFLATRRCSPHSMACALKRVCKKGSFPIWKISTHTSPYWRRISNPSALLP
ncbi:hypothetical protein JF818_07260, partial [Sphaerochaeta sp. S2]|nr:hypothetical protein [Sphaerochaeta sp. S2]